MIRQFLQRILGPGPAPTWFESLLFVALMSGPPRFRDRDVTASLSGAVDEVVILQVGVWAVGGLWVFARICPHLLQRGLVPSLNGAQGLGALLILALGLSIWRSPGVMLTAFTLGQFAVMLGFAWMFVHLYGTATYLRHLIAGLCVITLLIVAATLLSPDLVLSGGATRLRGDRIAPTGAVAAMALVFWLSNAPPLRSAFFWPVLMVFGALLAASQTRTAYVALLAYLAIGYVYGRGLRVRKLVPLMALGAVSLLALDVIAPTADYVVRDSTTIQTMSDRIPLWTHLTTAVMREEPVVGLGYYAASRVLAPQHNEALGNAHSVFFEVLVGGGVVGAAVYLALIGALAWYAARLLRRAGAHPHAVVSAGLLGITLVLSVTGSEGLHAGPLGFTFWSLTALLPALCRAAEQARARPRVHPLRSSGALLAPVHQVGSPARSWP
jgi:hypothetical protein